MKAILLTHDNGAPYSSIDLATRAQGFWENIIISCFLAEPKGILEITAGWAPEVSRLALDFWKIVQRRRDEILSAADHWQVIDEIMRTRWEFTDFFHQPKVFGLDPKMHLITAVDACKNILDNYWYPARYTRKNGEAVSAMLALELEETCKL